MIEARLTDRLTLVLYDTEEEKVLKSFPQKNIDQEKRKIAIAKFDRLKKDTKELITREVKKLKTIYVSGKVIEMTCWVNEFLHDPIGKKIAQLLVWGQKTNKNEESYFTVYNGATITSDNAVFSLKDAPIFLAHPVEMNEDQIKEWNDYFTKKELKQPFAQIMYEPIIRWDRMSIANRYEGATLSNKERYAVKRALTERRVLVKSDEMDRVYNPRTGRYEFSNSNIMQLGNSFRINYTVDAVSKDITLGQSTIISEYSPREMNTVLMELDKAAISTLITHDVEYILTEDNMRDFTISQVSSFLDLAIKHNSHRCSAWLLNYKNKKYPNYEEVEEFTLDF